MRIPIRTVKYGEERLLLEFQGTFVVEDGRALGELPIGTLVCDGKAPPTISVGHHELQGKVVDLKRPVAILVKTYDEEARAKEGDKAVSYEMMAVIRKKAIFQIRPKSVLDSASKGLGVLKKGPS